MALQVSHILSLLGVPNLDIVFHEASRQKGRWVKRVEANSSYDCFVALQLHLKRVAVLLRDGILVEVFWGDQDFNRFIVRPSGYQIRSSTPINTVN